MAKVVTRIAHRAEVVVGPESSRVLRILLGALSARPGVVQSLYQNRTRLGHSGQNLATLAGVTLDRLGPIAPLRDPVVAVRHPLGDRVRRTAALMQPDYKRPPRVVRAAVQHVRIAHRSSFLRGGFDDLERRYKADKALWIEWNHSRFPRRCAEPHGQSTLQRTDARYSAINGQSHDWQ